MISEDFQLPCQFVLREGGQEKANEIGKITRTLPIKIVDVDMQLAKEVARFKAMGKIAYADCFAAVVAFGLFRWVI